MSQNHEGRRLRDQGIARLNKKLRSPLVIRWKSTFWRELINHAGRDVAFSSDDIRRIAPPPIEDNTYHPNQISAMFAHAVKAGLIRPYSYMYRSALPSRHAGKSSLYKGVAY